MLAGPPLSSGPSCPSSSALVYMSRYCVSAVPGVGGTEAGTGAGAATAAGTGAVSVSLLALSRSTVREGRSESVRRGASVARLDRVKREAALLLLLLLPSRGRGRPSGASVSSVWLRGGGTGGAVVDRLVLARAVVVTVLSRPRIPAGVTGTGGLTPLEVG